MEKIYTENAPKPAGHYSQAVVHNGLVFVSGQIPIDPVTGTKLTGEIEAQTHQVLKNLESILQASGSDLSHLLKVNLYVSDMSLWDRVNTVYAEFMGDNKPARAVIPTRELHYGFKIEVEAVAATRE
jgi:2-iminobutanoate/2-iminopropanoate deaminase